MDQTKPVENPTTVIPAKPESEAEPKIEPKDKSLLNKDDEAPIGAPEKYEDFKLPEGVTLAPETVTEAQNLFKELNLPQAQAQKLVDFHVGKLTAALAEPQETVASMREGWRKEITSDPELGKRLPDVKQTIGRALDGLGDPKLASDFRDAMDLTGAGDNPAFIRAFYKLAQKATEGRAVPAGGPSRLGQTAPGAAKLSPAQAIYPNLRSANDSPT